MQPAVARAASDDRVIVELLRGGQHEAAFAELLRRYEDKIFRLCCALLRDRGHAEDAAQESLVRIWKALDRYDGRAALSTWIYAITRNRCLTALERRRTTDNLNDSGEEVQTRLRAVAASQEEPAESDQRSERLRELVDSLPERLRCTLQLFYFEDRSIAEVARMLGCPEGTVKTHLFRARAALAEQLRRLGLDEPGHWLEGSYERH